MRFVFWGPYVSIHQASLLRAIASRGISCTWVVDRVSDERRAGLGFHKPDIGEVTIVSSPTKKCMASILAENRKETIHVLGGFRSCQTVRFASQAALHGGFHMGWMVEALEPGGLRGLCRKAIYASWAALFGKRVEFILAMGNLGVRSFRRVGFSKTPIFPFGYTVEVSSKNEALARSRSRGVEIAFVGRLEAFKGVDNLLRAVASNDDPQIRLFLIGDGALRSELEMLAAHLELNRRVQFLGAVPNSEARRRLRSCDLLVLPSRYDGWGAVVNEALMEGIPVVCSDRCGAADLLADSWRGEVFPWNNQQALLAAVKARCSVGPLQEVVRKRIRDWSACLTGDSMAEYFLSVMEHVYCGKTRPEAPWANARAGAACAVDPLRESFRGKQAA